MADVSYAPLSSAPIVHLESFVNCNLVSLFKVIEGKHRRQVGHIVGNLWHIVGI